MRAHRKHTGRKWPLIVRALLYPFVRVLLYPLLALLIVLVFPLIVLLLTALLLYAVVLQLVIWRVWCSRGINVLFIYSESPIWQDYIETEILPGLPESTVVLNWSQRRQWRRFSMSVRAFRLFGGDREFNPMVIIFRPFRWAKTFRFWKAFRDYKHGKRSPLESLQQKMFQYLEQSGINTTIQPPAAPSWDE